MLDLTPLDLEEAEEYVFETHRVSLNQLVSGLQYALQDAIEDSIGEGKARGDCFEIIQKALNYRISSFNTYTIQKYNRGNVATAKAGAELYRSDLDLDVITYEAWVDYRGITQKQCDSFPPYLLQEVYGKYLEGFSKVRSHIENDINTAKKEIEACIIESFQRFKGQHINQSMMEAFHATIKQNIISTGLVDKVEVDFTQSSQIQIKSTINRSQQTPLIIISHMTIN